MAQQIQIRRGTAADAVAADPILAEGEFGYEVDTGVVKIGDGVTVWSALPVAFTVGSEVELAASGVSFTPAGSIEATDVQAAIVELDNEKASTADLDAIELTPGPPGDDGASAYEVAIANGFIGTEVDWLASLEGPIGPQGDIGPQGVQGLTGPEGPQGEIGPVGPEGEQGPPGNDGESAYEVAVAGGFIGTEVDWLASLVGPEGPQGEVGPEGPQGPVDPTATMAIAANGKGFVNHGNIADTARPSGFASIEWSGSVEPANAIDGDTWIIE